MAATWQRWTIDELDAGLARVAVAESAYPLESSAAEAQATEADVDTVREAVLRVEDAPPADIWGDEEAVYLHAGRLETFLKRRADIRALPDPRPLREGDVFWIVLPVEVGEETMRELTPQDLLGRAEQLSAQVWDVTAAARQAVKRTYDAAVRAASEEGGPPASEEEI
ncbi:MAG: hypothetical protein ACRDGV_10790 [Candidatus Limnocylindria bacterium]